jgi:Ca-activated chloride channel homolog
VKRLAAPARSRILRDGSGRRPPVFGFSLAAIFLAFAHSAAAGDVPARNREGNRLFQAGKFADAEKAYREAQAEAPGKPELLYNAGNALLKQKKYEPALQSLKQAVNSGDRNLQSSSWFNAGNALFESSRFKEAVDAYTQSLRLSPSDTDAKHNLELALRRQQQQQQQQNQHNKSGDQQPKDQKQKEQGDSGQQQKDPKPDGKQQPRQPDKGDQEKPADPRSTSAGNPDASFSRERALQILDALRNQELVEQKKLLETRAKRRASGRDW